MKLLKHLACRQFLPRNRLHGGARKLSAAAICLVALAAPAVAMAGTPFFINPDSDAQIAPAPRDSIQIFTSNANDLVGGMEIDLTLPSGQSVSGSVQGRIDTGLDLNLSNDISGDEIVVIPLDGGAGALRVYVQDDLIVGFLLFDSASIDYYSAAVDSNGRGQLDKELAEAIQCVSMPVDTSDTESNVSAAELANVPDLNGLKNLESRPGASRVIYIDYHGGVVSGTAWNEFWTSGADIPYAPFSEDADTANFSAYELYLMYVGWLEMAEDYAPFDVNITTKLSVFEATPINRRSQIISTPSSSWVGGGGIAYIGVFGRTTDYYSIGWTFNATAGSLGQTHSHEAGHQMDLLHDGTAAVTYYRGHGRWGPVMGAPFNQEYVQWSKGEYPGANNQEDDLAKINLKLTTLTDDVGNDQADALMLEPPVFGVLGLITPDGLYPDPDVYTFTLNADNPTATVEVATTLGAEGENFAANAALNATLVDSTGLVVASMTSADISPLSPFTNKLSYTGALAAGTYFLTVDAMSPDINPATGFDEYGNGGQYLVSVDAVVGPPVALMIDFPVPGSELANSSEVFTWSYGDPPDTALLDNDYWLYLGSAPGKNDIVNSGNIGAVGSYDTSSAGSDLPLDGRDVHARLWYRLSGATGTPWEYIDASYTTADIGGAIVITSPDPDSTEPLPGTPVTFEWEDQNGSTDFWWIYAGSAVGKRDYHNSGVINANLPSSPGATIYGNASVGGLPVNGSTVYVRLWNREIGGAWESNYFTYTASSNPIVSFSSPSPGSVLPGPTVTFEFADTSEMVGEWWLYLGSNVGAYNHYNSGNLSDVAEATVNGLPTDGETIYARLWYRASSSVAWQYIDAQFQASSSGG